MTRRAQSRRRLAGATASVVVLALGAGLHAPVAAAAADPCPAFFDEDADGADDLAIGAPGEDLLVAGAQVKDAGSVTVVHGDADGVFGQNGSTQITLETVGLVPQAADRFGAAVATADLNGDTCADLAVGAPGRSAGAGAVVVIWGSAAGLDVGHPQLLQQGSAPVGSAAEAGDAFGSTLAAAGSLPTGGAAALWVGSPGEDVGSLKDAGMITELDASVGGLLGAAGVTHVHQDSAGVPGGAEAGDRFGERLSGGARTLLVGVPHEDVGALADAGTYLVHTLSSGAWQGYTQGASGVPGKAEAHDWFGSSVALAPGCAGATDEVFAVGASGEDLGSLANAGNVTLRDQQTARGRTLQQGAAGVPGPAEAGDGFGATVITAGSLVVGSPREDVGSARDGGAVTLVDLGCNATDDVVPEASRTWTQALASVPGEAEPGDLFGSGLGASLVGVTASPLQLRLVVGAPGEGEGTVVGSGNVTVFAAVDGEPGLAGARAFGQAGGIADEPEAGDGFGGSLDATNATAL